MSFINKDNKTDWTADLVRVRAQIAALGAALETAVSRGTRSYLFNAGKGDQRETFESPQMMIDSMDRLVQTRDKLKRKLSGRALMRGKFRP